MLHCIQHGITLEQLEPCGTLQDIGAEMIAGDDAMFGLTTFATEDESVSAGYFGVRRCSFRLPYTFHEQAVVTLGEVKITDERTGETTFYKAGDAFFVDSGTTTVWEVLSETFTKHYLAVD